MPPKLQRLKMGSKLVFVITSPQEDLSSESLSLTYESGAGETPFSQETSQVVSPRGALKMSFKNRSEFHGDAFLYPSQGGKILGRVVTLWNRGRGTYAVLAFQPVLKVGKYKVVMSNKGGLPVCNWAFDVVEQ
jgi:hypothetical protein